MGISICIDIDWLSYKYFPNALSSEDLSYRIEQDSSLVWTLQWYSVLTSCILKLVCLDNTLKQSSKGSALRNTAKSFLENCLISNNIPDDIGKTVMKRLVAISWIELCVSVIAFVCFFGIEFNLVSSLVFLDTPNQLISLQGSLLLKGASGFLLFLSLVHNVSKRDMIGLFCHQFSSSARNHARVLSKLDQSMKCIIFTKLIDFVASAVLWMGLVSAHRETGFDAPKEVSTFLGLIFSIQIVTSILTPILGINIIWWVSFLS